MESVIYDEKYNRPWRSKPNTFKLEFWQKKKNQQLGKLILEQTFKQNGKFFHLLFSSN